MSKTNKALTVLVVIAVQTSSPPPLSVILMVYHQILTQNNLILTKEFKLSSQKYHNHWEESHTSLYKN